MKSSGKKYRGPEKRKLQSAVTVFFMVTAGMLIVFPLTMPNAKAYTTPGTGVVWDMDDLVANSGGAVTGGSGSYVFHDWWVTINAGDTLNVLPGDICSFEVITDPFPMPPCILEVQGSIYALGGDVGITFTSNETSPAPNDWEGISINGGGYGQFENVIVEYSNRGILVFNTAGTGTVSNCTFRYNYDMGLGYALVGGNSEVRDCYFTDTGDPAIFIADTSLRVINNTIYGRNAPPGSFMPGGDAIYMTGNPSMTTTISQNTIIGGNGDEFSGGPTPDGGHAIWLDNLEGMAAGTQVIIENNFLIRGGEGGPNTFDNGLAGAGGSGIYCSPLPDNNQWWMDEYSIEVFNNQQIIGGHGGDNNAATNGWSGDGGRGIYLFDDDLMGSALVSQNQEIRGGNGGNNTADHVGGDTWLVGNGGDAISAFECYINTKTDVLNNQLIIGGKGGNTTGTGNFGSAGMGGNGIGFYGTTNASIDSNEIFGGDGGNNTGTDIVAGNGGDGIHFEPSGGFESSAMIMTSNSIGGEGGDNYAGGFVIPGLAGRGGEGLSVNGTWSFAFSSDCNYIGGKGGDTYADYGAGENGGKGMHVWDSAWVSAWGGSITGGNGGHTLYNGPPGFGSWAGMGERAIYAHDSGTSIDIYNQNIIAGGNGGDNFFDTLGSPGSGGNSIEASLIDTATIHNSEVIAGTGGYNWVTGTYEAQGSNGISIGSIAFGATITENTVHECGTRGISFTSTNGQISDNEVYNCSTPTLSDGVGIYCVQNSDPLIELNLIHDNKYAGIHCSQNSNPEILRNTIWNTTEAGIRCASSSPHIDRTTIDNSGEYGISLDFGSSSPFIENSSISNSGITDFYIDDDSHPVCLNTYSDKTATYNDALSNLTMNWFMHVQVLDNTLAPVAGAEVWVNDSAASPVLNAFTPANGWINWTIVTEYIENQAGRTYYTAHNATGVKLLQTGWAYPEPFMDASREVVIVLGLPVFNLYLDLGWNLVSLPHIQADESLDIVFQSIAGKWDCVMIYDALGSDKWHTNNTFRPWSLNDLSTLNHSVGFWINITQPTATLTVIGNYPILTDIPLFAGWNLVGYPAIDDSTYTVGDLKTDTGATIVEGFNSSQPYDLGVLPDSYVLKKGEAYWIKVSADCIWTLN
ncbi:MAG: right-handed parallel beta-helix repeat-containing protein [Thermoplasmata archaeon]|nr:right-handed parallel beta-helix repeat-containing protein [Thermoplasmata archaeon]